MDKSEKVYLEKITGEVDIKHNEIIKKETGAEPVCKLKSIRRYALAAEDGRFIRLGNFIVDSLKSMHNESLIYETIQNIRNIVAMAKDRDAVPAGSEHLCFDLTTEPILYDYDTHGYFD